MKTYKEIIERTKWITNGHDNMKIGIKDPTPDGWVRGKKIGGKELKPKKKK